jgi:hypothetical protein
MPRNISNADETSIRRNAFCEAVRKGQRLAIHPQDY